ncbi:hypothetical protein [Methylocella tundrae]|nr:hypothetical protein [Methylocella tundrae]WPP04635.1 hypothetical protein SIN04_19795 [Methylocella tundrae]
MKRIAAHASKRRMVAAGNQILCHRDALLISRTRRALTVAAWFQAPEKLRKLTRGIVVRPAAAQATPQTSMIK